MSTIFKYPLLITALQLVEMPIGSRVLAAQVQDGLPTLWAIHNQAEDKVNVEVRLVGTGEAFDVEDWKYIDTVQVGAFVWHIFMRE